MHPRALLLPALAAGGLTLPAAPAAAYFMHTVAPGESLSSVAAADGLSVSALAAANGLSSRSLLIAGRSIVIPPQGLSAIAATPAPVSNEAADEAGGTESGTGSETVATTSAPASALVSATTPTSASPVTSASTVTGGYTVRPGDTLWAIAARAGTSVAALAVANGLDPNGLLLAGRTIRVSGLGASTTATTTTETTTPTTQYVSSSSNPRYAGGGPYPTRERVSSGTIADIAAPHGVPGSLADAIGWQESGFNNDLVSPTGAVGVMQIEPGTWNWIQNTLTAGTPLSPYSALDNVKGGVLLLRSLLGATGGDPALAAAGYYQGLASVRAHGMYRDTRQYVRSVLALKARFGG